jgi:hypothetical protein
MQFRFRHFNVFPAEGERRFTLEQFRHSFTDDLLVGLDPGVSR